MANFVNLNERVNEWLNAANVDVNSILNKLIYDEGINEETLCDYLNCDMEDLEDFLNGDISFMSLETFASLIIATDKVMRIEPMQVVRTETTNRNQQLPQRDARGRFIRRQPQTDEVVSEVAPREDMQRDIQGQAPGFGVPRQGTPSMYGRCMQGMPMNQLGCQRIDLDAMTREQLVEFVQHVGATDRIDLRSASRAEIIRMLEDMGDNRQQFSERELRTAQRPMMRERVCQEQCRRNVEPQTVERQVNTDSHDARDERSTRDRLNDLVDTLSNNPNALNRLIEVLGL
jgi:hypothetical protein